MFFSRRDAGRAPWAQPYDAGASEADIFHCFRLLLGRHPNREEWRGHAARAGEPLEAVVAGYLRSLEFSRRNLLVQDRPSSVELARHAEFCIYVAADDPAVGRPVRAGTYEPEVSAVFRRVLRPGMGVIDIGANIGYFTMLSAALTGPEGFVLAIEPNPRNARLLAASRRANGFTQVVLSQTAAGPATGVLVLHAMDSNGTTSEPPDSPEALLAAETVACVRPEALLPPDRRIDLIKADVEGAEYKALLGCAGVIARDRPVIVSEFSPGLMPGISGVSGPDYLRWLIAQGYRLSVIEPDGALRDAEDWPTVMDAYEARGGDHIDIVATPG